MFGPGGRARRYLRLATETSFSVLTQNRFGTVLGDVAVKEGLQKTTTVYHGNVSLLLSTPTWLTRWRAETFATKEPETLAWIDDFPRESIFWDVGANVGLYSLYAAAARASQVVAIEPSVFNLECLARNISQNDLTNRVRVFSSALSDKEGFQEFNMSTTEWGGAISSFGRENIYQGRTVEKALSYQIWGTTLDKLAKNFGFLPRFLKIDVDGLEPQILAGGREVLAQVEGVLIEVDMYLPLVAKEIEGLLLSADLKLRNQEFFSEYGASNQIWARA